MNKEKIQKNIEDEILNKISEEKLTPKPRWEFLLKNIYFWIIGFVTVILGALSVAASIFVVKNIRWEFYEATHDNLFVFAVEFIPYLWITLFAIMLFFSYRIIRKTDHGYKYHLPIIAGVIFSASLFFGILFFFVGFGEIVEHDFGSRIPMHLGLEAKDRMLWNHPEDGMLIGELSLVDGKYILNTPGDESWNLITEHLDVNMLDSIRDGDFTRVVGFVKDNDFYVCDFLLGGPPRPRLGMGILDSDEENERKDDDERTIECEGVRPYQKLLKKI